MSLIVARKDGDKLSIVSDTKLTYPFHETKNIKTSPLDGVVKSIILDENLCISFAGEIEHAEVALKEINDSKDISSILEILQTTHKFSQFKTEFIFCVGKPELTIYEIKNGDLKETQMSWIGDNNAFSSFQKSMLTPIAKEEVKQTKPFENSRGKTNQPAFTITSMNLTVEVSHNSLLLSNISSAMDKVIEDENIDSVGGFKVNVIYDNKFFYNGYVKNYRSNVTMAGYGAQAIGHGSAQDGSYSVNFIGGSSDFNSIALHLSQAKFGIIYNRTNNGLLRPLISKLDEVDFTDYIQESFGIVSNVITEDRVLKFFNLASEYFNKKDYKKSEEFFDKALNAAKDNEKAKVLFNKGIILLNLNDKNPAMKAFSQTIKIDPSYTSKITDILHSNR